MLGPGDVLSDRYRLDERLATGGMGEVWRATDQVLGRAVAVKVLLPALLEDPDFIARFKAEARMMAALRHPGVVQVYDYGESDVPGGSVVFLVMALVVGEPLSHRLATEGRLPVGETMSIVANAADALNAVHAVGIVHRDVKPANLIVQPDGTVVLVDFGVAHDATATRLTGTNMVVGTALYMAPEQVSGQPVSAATDIYALGALAYHCLSGVAPFTGGTALEIAGRHLRDAPPPLPDDVPAPVQAVVGRALAKEPADRYPSAAAFAAAARAASAGTETERTAVLAAAAPIGMAAVPQPGAPATLSDVDVADLRDSPTGGSRRNVLAVAAVAAVLLAGLAVAAVLWWPDSDTNAPTPAPVTSATPSTAPTTTGPSRPASTRTTPAKPTTAPAAPNTPTATAEPTRPSTGTPAPPPTANASVGAG